MAPTSRVLIPRLTNVCKRTVWSFDVDRVIPDRLAIQILKSASTALIFANFTKITEIKQNEGVIVKKYWRIRIFETTVAEDDTRKHNHGWIIVFSLTSPRDLELL